MHVYSHRAKEGLHFYSNSKLMLRQSFLLSFTLIFLMVKELEAEKLFLYIDKCHNSVINNGNLPTNKPKRDSLNVNT